VRKKIFKRFDKIMLFFFFLARKYTYRANGIEAKVWIACAQRLWITAQKIPAQVERRDIE
jgi:hypothetical protein